MRKRKIALTICCSNFLKIDIQKIIDDHPEIKKYAYIWHNSIDGLFSHCHLYLDFGSKSIDSEMIWYWFNTKMFEVRDPGFYLYYIMHSADSLDDIITNIDLSSI